MNARRLFGCKVVTSKYLPDDWIVLMNEVRNERGELEPRFTLFVVDAAPTLADMTAWGWFCPEASA